MITKDEYIKRHNHFSWEIANACDAFFAMNATLDWNSKLLARLKSGQATHFSQFATSLSVVSNSLVTYFFIAACKIREQKRSTLNLHALYTNACELNLLTEEQNSIALDLLASTLQIYNKLKKARGMTVAHLQNTDTPFNILKSENVGRKAVRIYLEECKQLFQILGEPFNADRGAPFEHLEKSVSENMSLLYEAAWPFESHNLGQQNAAANP